MSMMQMPSMQGMPQGNPYQGQRSLYGGMPQSMQGGGMQGMGSPGAPSSQGMGASMPSMGGYNPAPTGQYPPMMGMGGGMGGGMGQQPQMGVSTMTPGQRPQYNANGPTMDPSRMGWGGMAVGPAQGGAPGFSGYHPQAPPTGGGFGGPGPQKWMGGGQQMQPGGQTPQNYMPPMGGAPQMGGGPQMSPGPVQAQSYPGAPQPGGYAGGGNSGTAGEQGGGGGFNYGAQLGNPATTEQMYGPQAQANNTAYNAAQTANTNARNAAGLASQQRMFGPPQQQPGGNPNGVGAQTGQVGFGAPQGWSPFGQQQQPPNGYHIAGGPRPGMM